MPQALSPLAERVSDFLKAAHTLALAQAEAHRTVKAASPKATVGSAYEMAPAYPKTDSDEERAAARVRAFHAWTLLDNFQWAEDYTERYGNARFSTRGANEWCALKTALYWDSSDPRGRQTMAKTHENFVSRLTTKNYSFDSTHFHRLLL
jgi:beta-glucosidase/6-phospho-beta-glucosidase/beta-galactosidase